MLTCGGRRLGRLAAGCLAFAWLAVGALGSWSPLGFRRGARRWLGSRLAPWGAGLLLVCFVAATKGFYSIAFLSRGVEFFEAFVCSRGWMESNLSSTICGRPVPGGPFGPRSCWVPLSWALPYLTLGRGRERGDCGERRTEGRAPERGVRGAQLPGKRKRRVYVYIYINIHIYNMNNRKSTNLQTVYHPELVYPDSDFS